MKLPSILCLGQRAFCLPCAGNQTTTPRTKHIMLPDFDALSARNVQREQTPHFNRMSYLCRCCLSPGVSDKTTDSFIYSPFSVRGKKVSTKIFFKG